jgi:hypothetical protein
MSVTYQGIGWNRQKRRYDVAVLGVVLATAGFHAALTA